MSEDEINEPSQKEEHYRKLIAALRGSPVAAAWEEFKHGGMPGSASGTKVEAAGEGSPATSALKV